jgi:hypothetical protein
MIGTPATCAIGLAAALVTPDMPRLEARRSIELFIPPKRQTMWDGVGLCICAAFVRIWIDAGAIHKVMVDPLLYIGQIANTLSVAPCLLRKTPHKETQQKNPSYVPHCDQSPRSEKAFDFRFLSLYAA